MKRVRRFLLRRALAIFAALVVLSVLSVAFASDELPTGVYESAAVGEVDSARGTARARLPIELPAARGGLSIGLGLAYSSTAGEGDAGVGWSLSQRAIERHNASGGPRYRDPREGEAFEPWGADRFAYEGQTLVYVCTVGVTPCPAGEDFELGWTNFHYFRLERETSFTRFFWSPDGHSWVLQEQSGVLVEMGDPITYRHVGTSGAEFDVTAPDPQGNPRAWRWHTSRRVGPERKGGMPINIVVYDWRCVVPGSQQKFLTDIFYTPPVNEKLSNLESYAHHALIDYEATKNAVDGRFAPIWRSRPHARATVITVSSASFTSTKRSMVRRYYLGYEEQRRRSYLTSFVVEACTDPPMEEFGNDRWFIPPTACDRLPPTTLAYTPVHEGTFFRNLKPGTNAGGTLPVPTMPYATRNADGNIALVDVNADGLPDVVQVPKDPQSYQFLWLNTGSELRPSNLFTVPQTDLQTGTQLLSRTRGQSLLGDWNATGRATSLFASTATPNAFVTMEAKKRRFGYEWINTSNFTFGPFTRLGDFDGDGIMDRFFVDPNASNTWHTFFSVKDPLRGLVQPFEREETQVAESADPHAPPPPEFFYQTFTTTADMNGDGLADFVIADGIFNPNGGEYSGSTLSYFPSNARGDFKCEGDGCNPQWHGQRKPITFSAGTEATDHFTHRYILDVHATTKYNRLLKGRLHVHDVDGDGRADVILETPKGFFEAPYAQYGIFVFLNDDGTRFRKMLAFPAPHAMDGTNFEDTQQLLFGDMLGAGHDQIVSFTGKSVYLWSVLSPNATRPGLLRSIDNGQGATVAFEYGNVAQLDSEAASSGEPWLDHVPQNSAVVTKVTSSNNLPGGYGTTTVRTFRYRDPAFDAWDRRLLGFGQVSETFVGPGSRIVDTFYFFSECQRSSEKCAHGAPQALKDPKRLDAGLPWKRELRAYDGTYLSTTRWLYRAQFVPNLPLVRFTYPWRKDTWIYETDPYKPASGTPYKVHVVQPPESGDVVVRAVELPADREMVLRSDDFEHLRWDMDRDIHGHLERTIEYGRIAGKEDGPGIDEPIVRHEKWDRVNDMTWTWRKMESSVEPFSHHAGVPDGHARGTRLEYDDAGNLTAAYATLKGSIELDRTHEDPNRATAPAPLGASTDREIRLVHHIRDGYGNIYLTQTPTGRCVTTDYDTTYAHLPVTQSEYAKMCGEDPLSTTYEYERGLGRITRVVSPNGAERVTKYDAFGRATAIFEPSPTTGRVQSSPTVAIHYFQHPTKVLNAVYTVSNGGGETWRFVDGYGVPVVGFEKEDPAPGATSTKARWVQSGLATRDAFGLTTFRHDPRFIEGDVFDSVFQSTATGVTSEYDVFGRPTRVLDRDGFTVLSKTAYHKLRTEMQDAESVIAGKHANTPAFLQRDGHGRVITTGKSLHLPVEDNLVTQYDYLSTGEITRVTEAHGGGIDSTSRWFVYDSLGRRVLNAEPNTATGFGAPESVSLDRTDPSRMRAWRYAFNDEGELVGTSDARGCGKNIYRNALGDVLAEDFSPCATTQEAYTRADLTTGEGTETFYVYGSPPSQAGLSPTVDAFQRGRLTVASDRASQTMISYDGRGRGTTMHKRLAKPGAPAVGLDARYASSWFGVEAGFSDANRKEWETTGASAPELLGIGHSSMLSYSYSPRGLLTSVSGSYEWLVEHVDYDAHGVPLTKTFGDTAGTRATFGYDTRRRLTSVLVDRSRPTPWSAPSLDYTPPLPTAPKTTQNTLENLIYGYDNVNNIVRIDDLRKSDEWDDGAKPVSVKTVEHDDLYRVTSVSSDYGTVGTDVQLSPFAPDRAMGKKPVPTTTRPNRLKWQTFAYDWKGNVTKSQDDASTFFDRSMGILTYSPTRASQVDSARASGGTLNAKYDAAGNVTELLVMRKDACEATDGKCAHKFVYEWDEVGRLARAKRWDYKPLDVATGSADVELAYAYDANDRRILSTNINAQASESRYSAEVFPTLRLDGAKWLGVDYERTASTERVILGGFGRVVQIHADADLASTGRTRVFLTLGDHLGSTTTVIDKKTSEVVERASYQSFGAVESDFRPKRWGGYRDPYRFTGHADDAEVGLTYAGARYYHAALGRWLSADPLTVHAMRGDSNPYAYVRGRVLTHTDPTGLQDKDIDEVTVKGEPREVPEHDIHVIEVDGTRYEIESDGLPFAGVAPEVVVVAQAPPMPIDYCNGDADCVNGAWGPHYLRTPILTILDLFQADIEILPRYLLSCLDSCPIKSLNEMAWDRHDELEAERVDKVTADPDGSYVHPAIGQIVSPEDSAVIHSLGKGGEAAAGIVKNTKAITTTVGGKIKSRIPDALDSAKKILQEVKNNAYQHYSSQIKQFQSWAKQNGYTFELWTRGGPKGVRTELSAPLQEAINSGEIVHKQFLIDP